MSGFSKFTLRVSSVAKIRRHRNGLSHVLRVVPLALAFVALGFFSLRATHAATFVTTQEAESGVKAGNYMAGDTTGASGSASVKFGNTSTGPPPPPSSNAKPTAANTGVPVGTQLVVSNGDRTYSTDNQIVDGLDIHGYVQITGKNITIKNSIIRGGSKPCTTGGSQNSAPLWVRDDLGATATVQDSEISPSNATACVDGVWAANVTLLRMNIHGSVDGVKAYDGTSIKDSYIHDLAYFASDPNQGGGGGTHNDGIQSYQCNKDILVQHNNIDLGSTANANADYQLTQDGGVRCSNIVIDDNWLNGGGCTLNVAPKVLSTLTGVSITNNRFGRQRGFANCTVKAYAGTTFTAYSGNVWEDTGQPIPSPQP